ncbi:MAG: universal stress protein [Rhodospirillales bacterium]|nr:universal stress protein [Rhodospirillales bacterium]
MTSASNNHHFQRVLVAVDASPESRVLLEIAADLARCFESPLTGLYVEDEDMVSFAGLPVGREISVIGARVLDLTRQRLQSHFQNQASQIQRTLGTVAAARQISHSFAVLHGRPEQEIRNAAEKMDLLAIGPKVGATLRPRGQELRRHFLESSAEGLLVVPDLSKTAHEGPIGTIYTGTPGSERAVRMAIRIARGLDRQVLVALVPGDDETRALERLLKEIMGERTALTVVKADTIASFFEILSSWRPGLVVLPADIAEQSGWHWDKPRFPLLVLRERTNGDD